MGPAIIQPLEDAKGGEAAGRIEIREPGVVCELGASFLAETFRQQHPSRLKARPRIVGVGVRHPKRLGRIRAGTPRRSPGERGELGVGLEVKRLRAEGPLEKIARCGLVPGTTIQAGEEHQRIRVVGGPLERFVDEAPGLVWVVAGQGHPRQTDARRRRLLIPLEGAAEAHLRDVDLAARQGLVSELHQAGRKLTLAVARLGRLRRIGRRAPAVRQQHQKKGEAQAQPPPDTPQPSRPVLTPSPHDELA